MALVAVGEASTRRSATSFVRERDQEHGKVEEDEAAWTTTVFIFFNRGKKYTCQAGDPEVPKSRSSGGLSVMS
jgi:hypothetical protein